MSVARPDLRAWPGRRVVVVIDRPLGSRHPAYPAGDPYPVNYGYIPDTVSGDGRPIDAYVFGIDEPVSEAAGTVIAIVLRRDDVEDKLVVAADGRRRVADEIRALVAFQERSFAHEVVVELG